MAINVNQLSWVFDLKVNNGSYRLTMCTLINLTTIHDDANVYRLKTEHNKIVSYNPPFMCTRFLGKI